MSLTPIRKLGASALYYVAARDFVGVETAPTGSTDHTGLNEAAGWTVRAYDTMAIEHYPANGTHRSIRTPRAVLNASWDGSTYSLEAAGSHCQDTSGNITKGTTAASLAQIVPGEIEITLVHAMPSSTFRIKDATMGLVADPSIRVHVYLESISSTTKFRVLRYEDEDFATLAAADGDFTIAVYDNG